MGASDRRSIVDLTQHNAAILVDQGACYISDGALVCRKTWAFPTSCMRLRRRFTYLHVATCHSVHSVFEVRRKSGGIYTGRFRRCQKQTDPCARAAFVQLLLELELYAESGS